MPKPRSHPRPIRQTDPLGPAKRKEVGRIVRSTLARKSETKCFPVYSSSPALAVSTSGVFTSLTAIDQGAGLNQRIANEISLQRIRFHMTLTPSEGVGSDNYNRVRVILFRWKEDDGINAPTGVGEILDTTSSAVGFVGVDYPLNYVDRNDYQIIYDKVFTLNPSFAFNSSGVTQTDWSNAAAKTIRVNKKIRGNINFNGSATTGHGKLYLLVVSDSAAAAHPSYGFAGQIFYKDM